MAYLVLFNDFDQNVVDTIMRQLREANAEIATSHRETEDRRVRIVERKQALMDLLYVKAVSGSPSYS